MARWVRVARTDEVPAGEGRYFEVEGEPIAVFHVDGQYYAISDICTHEEASLAEGDLDGEIVECALHGARFNVRTGAVVAPPAVVPVRTYPVRIIDGQIEIEL
ncbi:MAG: non-heme iron oxygenase ferredoxin subunit [Chloroflexi bacterium]|jgi:3-phenylpropionate/trans-cinnamate dioxygenase ferredoxin subunit|nr:non-heme iron oxygenase ferredoxin subunit [Chloroflexota bacterium]